MMFLIFKATVLWPLRMWVRPTVDGIDNLPKGPAIIACNHLSFSDHFFIAAVVPGKFTVLVKSRFFTQPGVKGWLIALFFRAIDQIRTDRSGGTASESALRAGVKVLGRGGLLGIAPEGTRSPDGRLYRGRTGVARMALAAGCPVVPVALIGTEKFQPAGTIIPKKSPVTIRFGAPLDFSLAAGEEPDRDKLRTITDTIMNEVQRLSGQEYVDEYSPGPGLVSG
jgi:1-acyl-sn-glycerol-3-phosphate acyltransferase